MRRTLLKLCLYGITIVIVLQLYLNRSARKVSVQSAMRTSSSLVQYCKIDMQKVISNFTFVWREILPCSIEWERRYPPRINSDLFPLKVDMRKIVEAHKRGTIQSIKPINVYPFNFIYKPNVSHAGRNHVYLLFLIKSGISSFEKRSAIRETWTKETNVDGFLVKRLFIVGKSSASINAQIQEENKLHGDILQMDFVDSYFNNTWRTRGGIKWTTENCNETKYVMVVDDDFYVSTKLLLHMLNTSGNPKGMYMGWVNATPTPFRNKKSKWFVSLKDYPFKTYPTFVSAGTIVMTMDVVRDIHIASQYTKHFIFDDVFLGFVTLKLGIRPINNKLFRVGFIQPSSDLFKQIITTHDNKPSDLRIAWKTHKSIQYH